MPPPRRRKGHRNRLVRCQNGSLLRRPKISRKGIRCASVRGTEESLRLVSRWGSSLRSGVPLDLIISQLGHNRNTNTPIPAGTRSHSLDNHQKDGTRALSCSWTRSRTCSETWEAAD